MSKKYDVGFKSVYKKDYPFLSESRKGLTFACCNICKCDFSISHGGKGDITKHVNTKKHSDNAQCIDKNQKLDFMLKGDDSDSVTRAELLFTSFIVEHNLPINCSDHAGPLFRKMFPDSKIAAKYGSARTKTSAILAEMCMAEKEQVIARLKSSVFSIATDGSNDSDSKLYPIVVTFCNFQQQIQSCLLEVPVLEESASGLNIANLLITKLKEYDIPLENCIALGADNAPVMVGLNTGVAGVLRREMKNLFVIGCPCHLINLAAEKGSASLPVRVDEHLIDIFYFLERSSKRKEKFKQFQELYDVEMRKILKHVSTCWLSMGKCLSRLLQQWQPLTSLFRSEITLKDSQSGNLESYKIPKVQNSGSIGCASSPTSSEKLTLHSSGKRKSVSQLSTAPKRTLSLDSASQFSSREERLFMFLSSKLNKALCLFLSSFLPLFDNPNVLLQSSVPHIHVLRSILLEMLKNVMSRFVKPTVIRSALSVLDVDYHTALNQKDDNDLMVGHLASATVDNLCKEDKCTFFTSVRKCFVKSCDYMIHKFPFHSDVLLNAEVANIANISESSFSKLKFFVDKFPSILTDIQGTFSEEIDALHSQFCSFQLEDLTSVQAEERIDVQWALVGQLKSNSGVLKYDKLSQVMLSILTIPHSNAECERMFSVVKKTRTQFRSSLSNKTLDKLVTLKSLQKGKCFEQEFSKAFLKRAKSATNPRE